MIALISHSALGPWTSERLTDCALYVASRAELSDPQGCPWTRVSGPEDGVTAFAAGQDTLYLVSYRDAPRSQVLAVPFADPAPSRARSVVPSGDRAVEAVQVAGDHLLVRDRDGGIGRLRRVPLSGGEPEDIPMPVEGGILEWTGHPERPEVLLLVATWTDAPQVYRYDGHTGALASTSLAPPSPVDFGDVDARVLQAPARDGTLIPVTVIHRKGLALDGGNPTLLTGYGSYAPSTSSLTATPARRGWQAMAPAPVASRLAARWSAGPTCGRPWSCTSRW